MTVSQLARPVVLVVEQDPAHRVFIADNLTADGFEVHAEEWASDGLRVADVERPDVAVVGVNGGSGRDFARLVREGDHGDPRLPMILIGTDPSELDALRALDAGADDYVLRGTPYALLHARVRALLRRVALDCPSRLDSRSHGALRVDGASRVVTVDGEPTAALTAREFALLWTLLGEPSRLFTKRELTRAIGSRGDASGKALETHVARLRGKVGPGWIETRWGQGYRIANPVEVVT